MKGMQQEEEKEEETWRHASMPSANTYINKEKVPEANPLDRDLPPTSTRSRGTSALRRQGQPRDQDAAFTAPPPQILKLNILP